MKNEYWQLENIKTRPGEIPGTRFYFKGERNESVYICIPVSKERKKSKSSSWKISLVTSSGCKKYKFKKATRKESTIKNLTAVCEVWEIPVPPLGELLEIWGLKERQSPRLKYDWEGLERAERNLEWKKTGRLGELIERYEYMQMKKNDPVKKFLGVLEKWRWSGRELPTKRDILNRLPKSQALCTELGMDWKQLGEIVENALARGLIKECQISGQRGWKLVPA